jgi:Tol biopolymer transport system component
MAALLLLGISLAAVLAFVRHSDYRPRLMKLSVLPPEGATFVASSVPAISPNGLRVVFAASSEGKTQLWVRDLDSPSPWAVAGTNGAF